ncbi:alpha/beta hydrolase fold domain-containing protein [Mycoplasma sp. P36-A1]|uniref:alpha/beta hydrolase fold domain-containing protein n=1 Tax=Mycoplasma sp. P36-A1 TaxID=3252900 RepID=UPI003C2D1455
MFNKKELKYKNEINKKTTKATSEIESLITYLNENLENIKTENELKVNRILDSLEKDEDVNLRKVQKLLKKENKKTNKKLKKFKKQTKTIQKELEKKMDKGLSSIKDDMFIDEVNEAIYDRNKNINPKFFALKESFFDTIDETKAEVKPAVTKAFAAVKDKSSEKIEDVKSNIADKIEDFDIDKFKNDLIIDNVKIQRDIRRNLAKIKNQTKKYQTEIGENLQDKMSKINKIKNLKSLQVKTKAKKEELIDEIADINDELSIKEDNMQENKNKHTALKVLAVAPVVATAASAAAISFNAKVIEKRSVASKLIELGLLSMDVKNKVGFIINDHIANEAILDNAKEYSSFDYILPLKFENKFGIVETSYENVYKIENINGYLQKIVIFFHPGMFWMQPDEQQYKYATTLADNLNASVYIPIYPKAPTYNYKDVYKFLDEFYTKLIKENPNKEIIFVGNSSGGSLALGFAMYCQEKGLLTPTNIILNSPILDIQLNDTKIYEIEENDPVQRPYDLKIRLSYYANHEDEKDYRLSPIYGNIENIGKISVFTGTNDIFNIDARRLLDKSLIDNVAINFYEYEYMIPNFVQYTTPEASEALETLIEIVLNN